MPTADNEQAFLEALESIGARPASVKAASAASVGPRIETPTELTVAPPAEHVTAQNIWRHPDAHPIALDMFLVRRYGQVWLEWEPETLQALIPEDFKTQALSDLNLSKLQACKTLHMVDTFWQQWEVFIACLMPFNNEFPDFEIMQVPTVAQCLVACDVAQHIRSDVEWSSEMREYVRCVYVHDGIFLPVPPADFVTLEAPEEIDQGLLARRWADIQGTRKAPIGDMPVDEQLRRLLVVSGFLAESRARLRQQLSLHV